MHTLLQNIWSASVHGSIVILAVLLLRLVLKKAPKQYACLLWLLATLRLLMPFQIESNLSLQPQLNAALQLQSGSSAVQENVVQVPAIPEDTAAWPDDAVISTGDALISDPYHSGSTTATSSLVIDYTTIAVGFWLAGTIGMLCCSTISYLRLRRRVRDAVICTEGVWICPKLDTSFVLGFIRPQIYLNPGLNDVQRAFVLQHERCHIRRGDHWWKLLGFLTLSVHWFNPLVWLAYIILCRDLEMACDEAVVKNMNVTQRKAYSTALLGCSGEHRVISASPISFGEVSVKARIINVLNYKKPKLWLTVIAVMAIITVGISLLTTPSGMTDEEVIAHLYRELEDFQSQNSVHIKLAIEVESEFEDVISQNQEFWMDGSDWYRTYDYKTVDGSITTIYLQKDGIQYACEYSRDIEGFINRDWQEIPESSYAELPPILTKDWTQLEIMNVRHETDGTYSVVVEYDYSGGIHDTVYEYYFTFTLDKDGDLLGAESFSYIDAYVKYFGTEGIYESKTHTTFDFLKPDDAMLAQLIADALDN